MMKYNLLDYSILLLLILIGCSPTTPETQPYPAPGTFLGVWSQIASPDSSFGGDTIFQAPCTAIVSEADATFRATITNDSTKEVLSIQGLFYPHVDGGAYQAFYWGVESETSSLYGDTDKFPRLSPAPIFFTVSGDYFTFKASRGIDELFITCNRK
ncbi:MAG TPA: hypothetical protein VEW28_10220 [Candidatus Kapabacteria bacterium]|nr:hypothetical protein [Candidatus Kapabacteria bacterium]